MTSCEAHKIMSPSTFDETKSAVSQAKARSSIIQTSLSPRLYPPTDTCLYTFTKTQFSLFMLTKIKNRRLSGHGKKPPLTETSPDIEGYLVCYTQKKPWNLVHRIASKTGPKPMAIKSC
ncbi:hypothetical protein PoB_003585700 [Plakobranchus ocellatus]|uniref:Uncharacterized protein n=1 Tax=Plakobranchus ocellatus TaxID=259542 RepID=A0AAV4APX6_9GAST|nr:hypothetical protein PoB_003585700 [Plakobranchus ocellatus]